MEQELLVVPMSDPTECVPGSVLFYGHDRFKYMRHFSESIRTAMDWETAVCVRKSAETCYGNCGDLESSITEDELRLSIETACDAIGRGPHLRERRGRCFAVTDDDGELWNDPLFEYAMQNGSKSDMALLVASSYPPPDCDLRNSDRTRCVLLCGPFGGDFVVSMRDFWRTFLWMVPFGDFVLKARRCILLDGSALLIDYSELCPSSGKFVVHSIKI